MLYEGWNPENETIASRTKTNERRCKVCVCKSVDEGVVFACKKKASAVRVPSENEGGVGELRYLVTVW